MGLPILILGASGVGKSSSLRNFNPDEIGVFSVAGKRLPFRKQLPVINTSDYGMISRAPHGACELKSRMAIRSSGTVLSRPAWGV